MTSFADLTTIGVGGPIATFLEPTTRVGVIEAVEEADSQGLPLCVIGGESNMLVSDMPFEGVVVRDARRSISVLDKFFRNSTMKITNSHLKNTLVI